MNIFVMMGLSLFLIVILCAYMIVKLPKTYYLKYLLIPVVLAYGLIVGINLPDVQGYPYPSYPQGKFLLINFRSIGVDQTRVIELWITRGGRSRLYVIPYDEKTEQMLKMAKIREQEGELSEFNFESDGAGRIGPDGHSLGEHLNSRPINVASSLPPKR